MKTFVMTILIACLAVITAAIVYLDSHKTQPAHPPVAASPESRATVETPPENVAVRQPQVQPQTSPALSAPAQVQVSTPPAAETASTDSISPAKKMAATLLSAKSAKEKQALFDELRKDPQQLDAVISQLKQEAAQNPNNPEIPTIIGEAQINELRTLAENGGAVANHDQIGILAMQADQEFDTALQIDPKNWEAQFVKYSTLYYWPASPQTDNQAIQGLTSLIDQQENMSSSPEFAQTYVMLGNEYQKMGQPDKALATWQLGAQEFPGDSTLQKKIAGAAVQ
jgi:tetratricopeptide (TPR) repeat protein